MRAVILFYLALQADPTQQIVESLYPKNERLRKTRVGDLVTHLGIREGSRVADVGCGQGQFSVILSRVVGPSGHVWCEDIEKSPGREVKRHHAKNVTVVRGLADDPKLPVGSLDAVLMVIAYHEMPQYQAMMRHVREALKPGGRLVILDIKPNRTGARPREKQAGNHVLSPDLAAREIAAAGFRIVTRDDAFVDDPDSEQVNWLIVAAP